MEQIHNKLMGSSQAYANWHEQPHHKKVHWLAFLILAVVLGFLIMQGMKSWRNDNYNALTVEFAPHTAILTLDPQSKKLKVGDSFTVDVVLDTAGRPVDGVDLYSLHFDPTIVTVVDGDAKKAGVQIIPGTIMDFNAVNSVDQATGTIKFSQASQVGNTFTGKGVLATIHFKAVGKGNTYLKFDFDLGSTTDTNVAHKGKDQLATVVDALYTVE